MGKYDSREDTLKHIENVRYLIDEVITKLMQRAADHDQTKLIEPEKSIFDAMTPLLADCTYGSKEYKGYLKRMGVALTHHYACTKHHPESFEDGIKGMSLLDLIEMVVDWKAATLRHKNGDILKSLEINQKRFGYSDELKQIFLNTVRELDLEHWEGLDSVPEMVPEPVEINGKVYPMWSQFVEKREQWIGGVLEDSGDSMDKAVGLMDSRYMQTEIIDITLKPNGKTSAFFEVEGKDFSCGFDVSVGGVTAGEKDWLTFSGYMGHSWRIKGNGK